MVPPTTAAVRGAALMVLRSFVAGLAVAAALPASARAAPIEDARTFLASSQFPDGRFPGLPIIDTVEALRAMSDAARLDAAKLALFLSTPDNSEALFARTAALASTPYADPSSSAIAQDLLRTNTLGIALTHAAPDPLVLAAALRFALRSEISPGATAALLADVARIARADGSFAFADNTPDVALTAEIVRALDEARGMPASDALASAARGWLRFQAIGDRSALPCADLALLGLSLGGADAALAQVLVPRAT